MPLGHLTLQLSADIVLQELSYQMKKHQAQLDAEYTMEYDVLDTLARLGGNIARKGASARSQSL